MRTMDVLGSEGALDRAPNPVEVTRHARYRMASRGISPTAVSAAIHWGRHTHARNADIYQIGRKDVARARTAGLDLRHLEGVQVICGNDGVLITAYRNRELRIRK